MAEARTIIEAWRLEHNTERPHRTLKQQAPSAAAAAWEAKDQLRG